MILSILAFVGMAIIAYMSAVQGVYRAAMILVACILAGVLGFGLMGPLAGMLVDYKQQQPLPLASMSTWYFAADAVCLWAVFCIVFLGLRTLGEKFLQYQPDFPYHVNRAGGAILGVLTGYLTMGMCMILIQMLPTAPEELGYEAYAYSPAKGDHPESILPTDRPLWLKWDRGTLDFFGYLSTWPLGSDDARLFGRYGRVYPNAPATGEKYAGTVDDFLYYHWYRRHQFIVWKTNRPASDSPIKELARGLTEGPGSPLTYTDWMQVGGVKYQIISHKTRSTIDEFPNVKLSSGEQFVLVQVRFMPLNVPAVVDTDQFELIVPSLPKATQPRVLTAAKPGSPENTIEPEQPLAPMVPAAIMAPRNPRFYIGTGMAAGEALLDGATFKFTDANQVEVRTLVFGVRKEHPPETLRLNAEPISKARVEAIEGKAPAAKPAEAPKTPPAKPAEPKAETPKTPPAKAAEPKPAEPKPATK
jgi:hypothetical protein